MRPASSRSHDEASIVCESSRRVKKFCRAIIVPLVSQFCPPGQPATRGRIEEPLPHLLQRDQRGGIDCWKSQRLVRADDKLDGAFHQRAIGAGTVEDVAAQERRDDRRQLEVVFAQQRGDCVDQLRLGIVIDEPVEQT